MVFGCSADITDSALTQIIVEQEGKDGQSLMPINFLRQLIRFYGDSMQMLVPSYLEFTIGKLTSEQAKFRKKVAKNFGGPLTAPIFDSIEEQTRKNMALLSRPSYPVERRRRITALFMTAVAVSGVIGSPLSGLDHAKSRRRLRVGRCGNGSSCSGPALGAARALRAAHHERSHRARFRRRHLRIRFQHPPQTIRSDILIFVVVFHRAMI